MARLGQAAQFPQCLLHLISAEIPLLFCNFLNDFLVLRGFFLGLLQVSVATNFSSRLVFAQWRNKKYSALRGIPAQRAYSFKMRGLQEIPLLLSCLLLSLIGLLSILDSLQSMALVLPDFAEASRLIRPHRVEL